jgi:hypothetical protein
MHEKQNRGQNSNTRHKKNMKKIIPLALLVAGAAVTANAQSIISWNENNGVGSGGNNVPSTGVAGVVPAINWNNSNLSQGNTFSGLVNNTGTATTLGFTIAGSWGDWGIGLVTSHDANGTYNEELLGGYANTSSGVSGGSLTVSITGIPYSSYDVIAYFGSDAAGRTGTIKDANAGLTYDFLTIGVPAISGANAVLTQTTDTGGGNPSADYAIFSNVSGSSDTLTLSIPNGGGLEGFQIVAVPEPGTMALAALGGASLLFWRRRSK